MSSVFGQAVIWLHGGKEHHSLSSGTQVGPLLASLILPVSKTKRDWYKLLTRGVWRDSFSDYSQSYFTAFLWHVVWGRSGVFHAWLHWLPWRDLRGWKLMTVLHPLTAGRYLIIKSVSIHSTLDLISCFRWRKFFSWLLLVAPREDACRIWAFVVLFLKSYHFEACQHALCTNETKYISLTRVVCHLSSFCGSRGWPPH